MMILAIKEFFISIYYFIQQLPYLRIKRIVAAQIRRDAAAPGLPFKVGDRIKHRKHLKVDRNGGTGVVLATDVILQDLNVKGVSVRFDSMPETPMWCANSELEYER